MKIRYKQSGEIGAASHFNMSALSEVLTGDDSAFIKDLDVWLKQKKCWKSMDQAFRDHDLIINNYNTIFFEPKTEEDRKRGYTLY